MKFYPLFMVAMVVVMGVVLGLLDDGTDAAGGRRGEARRAPTAAQPRTQARARRHTQPRAQRHTQPRAQRRDEPQPAPVVAGRAIKRRCMDAELCMDAVDTGSRIELWLETSGTRIITLAFHANAGSRPGETEDRNLIVTGAGRRRLLDLKKPADGRAHLSYRFTYHIGAETERHDDSYIYRLPYRPGSAHWVVTGSGSRKAPWRHAVEWSMPIGTTVLAARGGIVVGLREDADRAGIWYNNYLWIQHADGTVGQYSGLKPDGVMVGIGEIVAAGQPIALSGNTGNTGKSTGPHLDFQVSTPIQDSNHAFRTFPVRFRTTEGVRTRLRKDRSYRAPAG